MGFTDRVIRTAVATLIAVLYILSEITGPFAIVLLALFCILIITSLLSFCPLYLPFSISTKRKLYY